MNSDVTVLGYVWACNGIHFIIDFVRLQIFFNVNVMENLTTQIREAYLTFSVSKNYIFGFLCSRICFVL
jgi:hypothetical protein